ncbi:MAG: secondary thiamine-phosphate synthase enzyme YjbQ [Athalassotoga sp.]|uniref:secondary thiamine-phosphate synthase enzyme YjbQ n=1 Tax=Athalassotoga sp. TaxID=2022597 RepID=UPI003D03A454
MQQIKIKSSKHFEFIDLTEEIERIVSESKLMAGMCFIYVPHTTAAVTINEDADPDVKTDIISFIQRLVPWNGNYLHTEGNSAAHILSTIIGVSVAIPFDDGALSLGRWQGIYFCEFDGPRERNVDVILTEAKS